MLKLSIKNPNTQATETYDVVKEFNQFYDRATEYGLLTSIFSLKVKDMKAEDAPIRLHADSDVGNGLLRILPDNDSLYDVRLTDESVSGVREELHDDLEANLVHEQYSDTEEMFDDIKEMLKSLAGSKLSFFCPLTGNISDHDGDYYETSNDVLTDNADAIEEAIAREQATEINMADYVSDHADIKGKLVFAEWGVEERRGTLYGKIDCYLTEALTSEETERLRDAIEGQNSDGLGEGFEQREIPIDDGDLYVSYWHSGDDYFLYSSIGKGQNRNMLGEIYRVSFIGHRQIDRFRFIEEQLDRIISELLHKKEYVEFYVGRNGDFDTMVASAVKRGQKAYGTANSSLILVIPYSVANMDCLEKFYDEIWYPEELYGVHHKAAITKRNEWFVEHSDLLVAYVERDNGGASVCLKKAEKKGIETKNIALEEE